MHNQDPVSDRLYSVPAILLEARRERDERMYRLMRGFETRSEASIPDLEDDIQRDYIVIDEPTKPTRACDSISSPPITSLRPNDSLAARLESEVARQLEAASKQRYATNSRPV